MNIEEKTQQNSERTYRVSENPRLYESYDRDLTHKIEGKLLEGKSKFDNGNFSENAVSVLAKRYLSKNEEGELQEGPVGLIARVSSNIAYPDFYYTQSEERTYETAQEFFEMMMEREFIPNSPTLMNAGRQMQQLSACFVLPVEDNMDSIFGGVANTAKVHQTGGGTGFSFGRLRRKNDFVASTYGKASGPKSFIQAYDASTDSVNQGGFRRGANMGIMQVDHPDILEFIHAKENEQTGRYKNFNFSVTVTNDFIEAVKNDRHYVLMNPREGEKHELRIEDLKRDKKSVELGLISEKDLNLITEEDKVYFQNAIERDLRGNVVKTEKKQIGKVDDEGRITLHARTVFDEIANLAWKNGEPGIAFIDKINEDNPTHPRYFKREELPIGVGEIEATNPCGEQPLLPYEACNLGSIDVGKFVKNREIDYERLGNIVDKSVHFLDNVVDMSNFPLEKIVETVHSNRKIGLGIMGLADLLIKLEVPYNSKKGREIAGEIMNFIEERGAKKSEKLAEERGAFPNFEHSKYADGKPKRNATITTIAPTGSISIIAGASSGIESLFDLFYFHTDADGYKRTFSNEILSEKLKETGKTEEEIERITERLGNGESLRDINDVPSNIKKIFVTSEDISVEDHVAMQAEIQKYTDNAVSKTINMPNKATVEDVKKAYMLAQELGCKGITVYRRGSRIFEVLTSGTKEDLEEKLESGLKRGELKKLPEVLPAGYLKYPSPWGHLHLHPSMDPSENYEDVQMFATLGKGGDAVNADLEAISRLASTILRLGGNLREHIIPQLIGIGSQNRIPSMDGGVTSLPDGLGKALKMYVDLKKEIGYEKFLLGQYNLKEFRKKKIERKMNNKNNPRNKDNSEKNPKEEEYNAICPECSSKVNSDSGCFTCSNPSCGWSRC